MSKLSTQKGRRVLSASAQRQDKSSSCGEWRDTKTAEQCLAHLCLSEHLSDISFTFEGDQKVKLPAHKFILSMRSAIFEAMFNGELAEKGDTVLIKDIEPDTMTVLLSFVYTDRPELNGENVLRCLYAAQKYGLTGLVNQCSEFLENNINKVNVCLIHEQAVFYDIEPLRKKCFDYILENALNIFPTKGFLQISHETLFNLLNDDRVSAEETDIFNAAVNWAQDKLKADTMPHKAKNERTILGNILYQIRFPIMPIAEFARVVTPTGILSNEEQVMLYQFLATQGTSTLNKFNRERRSGRTVTVDVTKHINARLLGYQQGLFIQIKFNSKLSSPSNQFCGHWELPNLYVSSNALRVISVKGAFVKKVKNVTIENVLVDNYETIGNKIVFHSPIKLDHGVPIQFHQTDEYAFQYQERSFDGKSYRVNIQENINGEVVNFELIPVGLETISFVKQYTK